jgi:hypothetical protein
MKKYNIFNMEIHDVFNVEENHMRIIRVPGGWIYESYHQHPDGHFVISSAFVPY